jgi:hypothetical protein
MSCRHPYTYGERGRRRQRERKGERERGRGGGQREWDCGRVGFTVLVIVNGLGDHEPIATIAR